MDYNKDVGATLLHYIMEQRAKVQRLYSGEVYDKDDPRYEIVLRHEADKLHLLESIAIDAGHEMNRTIVFSPD